MVGERVERLDAGADVHLAKPVDLDERRSGEDEFVRDRVDGVLVDGDAEMTAALADLVRDEAMRARMATHNRTVAPAFDWPVVLERTAGLYDLARERAAVPAPAVEETSTVIALEA